MNTANPMNQANPVHAAIHQANPVNAAIPLAPTFEILGRRVERLHKLIQRFSRTPGSPELCTWKEDLMRAFALSDITSTVDQVTTIAFLLEGDAVEYYHSLTKVVQDD